MALWPWQREEPSRGHLSSKKPPGPGRTAVPKAPRSCDIPHLPWKSTAHCAAPIPKGVAGGRRRWKAAAGERRSERRDPRSGDKPCHTPRSRVGSLCWAQLHPVTGWPPARDLGRLWPRALFLLSDDTGHSGDAVSCQPQPPTPLKKASCAMGGQLGTPQEHPPAESWQQIGVWWKMLGSCRPLLVRRCRG